VGSVSFTVVPPPTGDTTPPQVSASVTGNQDWAWNYVGFATVTFSAQDSGSGVDTVEYSVDGQPYAVYTKPLNIDQPGQHTVHYRATDNAGNTSDVQTAQFAVVESAQNSHCSKAHACTGSSR
jgi:hypothetical protein